MRTGVSCNVGRRYLTSFGGISLAILYIDRNVPFVTLDGFGRDGYIRVGIEGVKSRTGKPQTQKAHWQEFET